MSETAYSSILGWEVFNFMSIEHGKVEFDDRNIINFKGYNDSGKSAMLTALKVATTNSNASKQVGFIQDNKEYFRVVIYFNDGIKILRDKYINGQSLYEMYKDDALLYTSKSSTGALTKISEVPKPIADYLGLIISDGSCLNARSCFEKQLGVQTTGSENYKMFNTILKSEELSKASELLNNDKNKLLSTINSCESQLKAKKDLIENIKGLTPEIISELKNKDSIVDNLTDKAEAIIAISKVNHDIKSIPKIPEIDTSIVSEISLLCNIGTINQAIKGIKVAPELKGIDTKQLVELSEIYETAKELENIKIVPSCNQIDLSKLNLINEIKNIASTIQELNTNIQTADTMLSKYNTELDELNKQVTELGKNMVKCPHCGTLFNPKGE